LKPFLQLPIQVKQWGGKRFGQNFVLFARIIDQIIGERGLANDLIDFVSLRTNGSGFGSSATGIFGKDNIVCGA